MGYTPVARARSWFRQKTTKVRPNGTVGGDRFVIHDEPTEQTFADLLFTTALKTESSDKAKVSAGGTLESEQGLVVLATDAQAKANALQLGDRALVPQVGQLPTIVPNTNDFTTTTVPLDGIISDTKDVFDVIVDPTITTRNNFKINLKSTFVKWLLRRVLPNGGTAGQVISKIDNVDFNYGWSTFSVGGGDTYRGTSITSYIIGKGIKDFLVIPATGSSAYAIGNRIRVTSNANSGNYMEGIVTSWDNTTKHLIISVDNTGGDGNGPFIDWNINLGGDIPSQTITTSANLFVSILNGSDTLGDGSINKPFATIAKAVAVVADKQTIVIFGGSYGSSTVPLTTNVVKTGSLFYTLYCFPGVIINQSTNSFYNSSITGASRVDIYGEPTIIQIGTPTSFIVDQICKLYIGKIDSQEQSMEIRSKGVDIGSNTVSNDNTFVSVREIVFNTLAYAAINFSKPAGSGTTTNGTIVASFGKLEYRPQTGVTITGATYITVADPYSLSIINTSLVWRGSGTAQDFTLIKLTATPTEFSLDNINIRMGGAGATGTKIIDLQTNAVSKTMFRKIYASINSISAFLNGTAAQAVNVEDILLPFGSTLITGTATINAVAPVIADTRTYIAASGSQIATISSRT